jgi:hypothetical protein
MKRLLAVLAVLCMCPLKPAAAWNPFIDVRDNLVWTFGKTGSLGEAIKVTGSDSVGKDGSTYTSFLAGVADYRFLTFKYGLTYLNKQDNSKGTDTAKVGLKLTSFFAFFKNPPTPEMAFLQNIDVGPSFAMSLLNSPHVGTVLVDANYVFGAAAVIQKVVAAPSVSPLSKLSLFYQETATL